MKYAPDVLIAIAIVLIAIAIAIWFGPATGFAFAGICAAIGGVFIGMRGGSA